MLKMATGEETKSEQSPPPKRARYELEDHAWTLSNQEIVLHPVYDSGIAKLESELDLDSEPEQDIEDCERLEQVASLKSCLSENTLQRLASGEFEVFLPGICNIENQPTGSNYFNLLSDEVVLQIFRHLDKSQLGNVALVCRRFHQLTDDDALWTRMDISDQFLMPGSMGTLMGRQIVILRLANSIIKQPIMFPDQRAFSEDFSWRIMYLDLSRSNVDPTALSQVLSKCKRLRKISLESMQITDVVLCSLTKSLDLEVLNLAMTKGISTYGFKNLLKCCQKIKELNLAWSNLTYECISYICKNLSGVLSRLNLSGCRKLMRNHNVRDLVQSCPNLRELDLSDCTTITEEVVEYIVLLKELNYLSLTRCYDIPVKFLIHLKKIPGLTYLDIHRTYMQSYELDFIKSELQPFLIVNKFLFSSIARPTVGAKRSSIWDMRV